MVWVDEGKRRGGELTVWTMRDYRSVEPIILRFKRRGRWSGSMRVRGTRFQKSKKVKWQKSERRCVIRAFPPWLQAPPTPPLEFSEFRQRGCWVYRLD